MRPTPWLAGNAKPGLPFGNGRSYGDACLNPDGVLWTTRGLDHLIGFNRETGCLTCEAGVLLKDVQALVVPAGWMLPVTPGTQLITVGGAIANDVHGKNHHRRGTFGCHVRALQLIRSDSPPQLCSRDENTSLFNATTEEPTKAAKQNISDAFHCRLRNSSAKG
jgi:FAD/FMN-containing dehydrogenase